MRGSLLPSARTWAGAACLCSVLASGPASAQSDWLKKAVSAAKESEVGKSVSRASVQAQMLDATTVSLEERGLPTVAVGSLVLGIAGVEVKDDVGVRVHAFLHNPTAQTASVPLPEPDLFVLVDGKGLRFERVAGPSVEDLAEGAATVDVPALERVGLSFLFAAPKHSGPTATLKVGELGLITGIPVRASAAGGAKDAAAPSVWTAPRAAPPPPGTPDTTRAAGAPTSGR